MEQKFERKFEVIRKTYYEEHGCQSPPMFDTIEELQKDIFKYYQKVKNKKPQILPADSYECLYFGFTMYYVEGGKEIGKMWAIGLEKVWPNRNDKIEDLRQWIDFIQGKTLFNPYKDEIPT